MSDPASSTGGPDNIARMNGLTVYTPRIQCVATRNDREGVHNEADSIIVDTFLHTLAEIVLNVAHRRVKESENDAQE